MKLRIQSDDNFIVSILKLVYLIPMGIILYVPVCFYEGAKELGNPVKGIIANLKERYDRDFKN